MNEEEVLFPTCVFTYHNRNVLFLCNFATCMNYNYGDKATTTTDGSEEEEEEFLWVDL